MCRHTYDKLWQSLEEGDGKRNWNLCRHTYDKLWQSLEEGAGTRGLECVEHTYDKRMTNFGRVWRKAPEREPWFGVCVGILMTNFGGVWRKAPESEALDCV